MLEKTEHPDGIELVHRHGRIRTVRRGPGVVVAVLSGVSAAESAAPFADWLSGEIADHGSLAFFADADEMTSYHTDFRKHFTNWLRDNREHLGTVHVLVSSRVVQMGINIVNPLVGNFVAAHSNRAAFEQRLEQALVDRRL